MTCRLVALSAAVVTAAALAAAPADRPPRGGYPAPKTLGPVETYGANIRRAMSLMATSTPLKRNTVRVLFYGQSISAQEWTTTVAERLRRRYPMADLVIENRAILGFTAEYLVHTAEADLYPFYPDLVIFHDYGQEADFEAIVRRLRERTTADVLIATDHVAPLIGERMDEEADLAKVKPSLFGPWRNRIFLPRVAKQYGAELADVRTLWKRYLADYKLSPSALLYDDLHLNAHGNYLMGEVIDAHLRHRPDLPDDDRTDRVTTFVVGTDVEWKDGKLVLPFDGNRVDLVCQETADGPAAAVRIDGRKPSEFPELYVPTRALLTAPRGLVPPLLKIGAEKMRAAEDWRMVVTDVSPDKGRFKFRVVGSVTGEDGAGESGKPFVSKSGRVAFEPVDFNVKNAVERSPNPTADRYEIRWSVAALHADRFAVPAVKNPFGETVVTVAQGLTNGRHTLELTGGPDTPLAAVRVYRPPLAAK